MYYFLIIILSVYLIVSIGFTLKYLLQVIKTANLIDKYGKTDWLNQYIYTHSKYFPIPFLFLKKYNIDKLELWLNEPRISLKTGDKLYKINQNEIYKYLTQKDQTEKKLHVFDYHIWVSKNTDETLIVKTDGNARYAYPKCKSCGAFANKVKSSTLIKSPTQKNIGKKETHYICLNCKFEEVRLIILPKKQKRTKYTTKNKSTKSTILTHTNNDFEPNNQNESGTKWGGGSSIGGGSSSGW